MATNRLLRIFVLVSLFVLAAALLIDPYTWRRTGGDLIVSAPLWQRVVAWASVVALGAAFVMTLRRKWKTAIDLALLAAVVNLGWNVVLVGRDGMARFVRGIGAEPYLFAYLLVWLWLFVVLGALFRLYRLDAQAEA